MYQSGRSGLGGTGAAGVIAARIRTWWPPAGIDDLLHVIFDQVSGLVDNVGRQSRLRCEFHLGLQPERGFAVREPAECTRPGCGTAHRAHARRAKRTTFQGMGRNSHRELAELAPARLEGIEASRGKLLPVGGAAGLAGRGREAGVATFRRRCLSVASGKGGIPAAGSVHAPGCPDEEPSPGPSELAVSKIFLRFGVRTIPGEENQPWERPGACCS